MSYKVLARKYRPDNLKDLIGQETSVKILNNSLKFNELPHAILLTGIRGVGKTTIARIIAKIVNCKNIIEKNIIEACNNCSNCLSSIDGSNPDIIEMDAASKTGVNDIREIIDNSNYLPISGKYKIYIIDEVHMLSNNAFNALLKTLEEPPSHVIFIFATTEVRKLPVTILSRCQKLHLKRLDEENMLSYLQNIAKIENINIEYEALKIIVNNSDGSVRDGLSLLDQTKSLCINNSVISSNILKNMLGYSDNDIKYSLFNNIINSKTAESLKLINQIYYDGYDLISLFNELLELINIISKFKIINENNTDYETSKIQSVSENIKIDKLTIFWQMILKAIEEIKEAPVQLRAAEMVIIRLCYSAKLPSPIEIIEKLSNENDFDSKNDKLYDNKKIYSFNDIVELCKNENELILYNYLTKDIKLVNFENFKIEIALIDGASDESILKLSRFLFEKTNNKWIIKIVESQNSLTIQQIENIKTEDEKSKWLGHPVFKSITDNFGEAEIKNVRNRILNQ